MTTHSPAWYDLEYNNRARVPDYMMYMQRWAKWSEQVRAQTQGDLDVAYGQSAGQTLDVFHAPRAGAPVVVFIHGGYWRSLDKSDHTFVVPAILQAGAMPVVVNYDLAPRVRVSEICLQMVRALDWVWRNAGRWGGDPGRIHVVGHSAGGHLAAMVFAALWKNHAPDLPSNLVKSAMAVSGVNELESVRRAGFVQADLKLSVSEALRCSPAWMPAPKQGVIHCLAGAQESPEFLRQNTLLRKAWGERRVPTVEDLPGENHFSVLDQFRDADSRLVQLLRQMVQS